MKDLFAELDATTHKWRGHDRRVCRAPIPWPGSKSRHVEKLIEYLPLRESYIEPFGGSGAVLLARTPSELEVYNDKYGGIVSFYRCLKDEKKLAKMVEWLEWTVHSREEFEWARDNWKDQDTRDDAQRAAMWFYSVAYSFGGLGRNWARDIRKGCLSGKVRNARVRFAPVHRRLAKVQIENMDFRTILEDYDNPDAVFYCDPPYLEVYARTYKNEIDYSDHVELLNMIFEMDAFVAVSSYKNDLYESKPWDHVIEIERSDTMQSLAYAKGSNKEHLSGLETRSKIIEKLYIKEST